MDSQAELNRLRDRVHKLTADVAEIKLRQAVQTKRCDRVERAVDEIVTADAVAAEVSRRMKAERAQMFSVPAKLAAFLVSICAVASFVLQVVPHG